MRVEELAGKAGVSVDTVRFYQKQGLLPPPAREGRVAWYTADHLARMARVKELRRRGFTLAVIRRFLDGELDRADEPLAAAVSEAVAPGGNEEFVTAEELATRSGVPLPLIDSLGREGLLVPRLVQGEPRYTADDVRIVSAGLRLLQAGLPMAGLLDLARAHHSAVRAVATQAVELFARRCAVPCGNPTGPRRRRPRNWWRRSGSCSRRSASSSPITSAGCCSRSPRSTSKPWGIQPRSPPPRPKRPAGWKRCPREAGPGGPKSSPLPSGAEKVAAVDAMFDAIAPGYDVTNRVISLGLDVGWRRRTVRSLGLPPGGVVLDLACGTGDLCRELVRQGLGPVGVDRSAGMLAAARASETPLVRGDGLALPFRAGALDGIVCGFALRNFAALGPALAECARVLRPGGRLALLEVDAPSQPLLRFGHRIWFGKVVPFVGGLVAARSGAPRERATAAYRYLPASVAYLPPAPELLALLGAAGFTAVERHPLSGGIAQLLTGTRS